MEAFEMKYYNYKDSLSGKGKLITLDELESMNIPKDKDSYLSIYSYNKEHKNNFEKMGTLSGIKDVTTNTLVWDLDNKKDTEFARLDTITLAKRLCNDYNIDPDDIVCYFSSNKGFHVILAIGKEITPEQFKKATGHIALGLKTYDSAVCDPQRILRLEHTKNPKSGLYKIPLHIEEVDIMSMEEIKNLAKTPRLEYQPKANIVSLPDTLFYIPEKKEKKKTEIKANDVTQLTCPKGWKPYKWALAEGYFEPGDRHEALMVIAATARSLGYPKEHAYQLCKAAINKQAERYGQDKFDKEELYKNIIEDSVFSDSWNGGAYSPTNHPWLKKYCEEMGFDISKEEDEDKTYQLHDIEAEFVDYVKNIDENTVLTGIPELDEDLPLTIGMNLGVIGAASSGKTALALKILKNTSDAGVLSVFASLDMRRNRLFEKLLYRISGLGRKELYALIQADKASDIFAKVREEYKNVFFYDRSCPSVDDIRKYIGRVEEITGRKVKLVMLDYFERVNAERSDDTAASKEVAGKLQDLVTDLNICMVTLVQPNKFALSGGPDTPILNYTSIKGSSFMYQSFRAIISIWRPFFTPELKDNDKFLQMAILKNDLGELNMFDFGWEGKRGEIWSISEEEQEELDNLLEEKKKSKQPEEKTWQ